MSKVEIQVRHEERSLVKGMLAGLVGGLAAMAVKTAAEKFYASRMDHSALAQQMIGAFLPPRFKPPQMIAASEVDAAMDHGRFMFVVVIPPR